jgi:oligopeptide transport system substrate-binding protein
MLKARQMGFPAFLILWVALLAAVSFACSAEDDGDPDLTQDEQDLRLWVFELPTALDPSLVYFAPDAAVANQLFRGLLWYDEELELAPMAASEVPSESNGGISGDGLVYTFKLRDDLKWSDGQPLTAAAFEYGIKRLLDPRTQAPYASAFFNVTGAERFATADPAGSPESLDALADDVGVKAADDKTLVVSLNSPQPSFLHEMVTIAAMPLREDVIAAHGENWVLPENFVGSGPYVLESMVPGEQLVLKRNPNWWLEPPLLDSVTLVAIPDQTQAFNAYLAGDLDYVGLPPEPEMLAVVEADPALKEQSITLPQLTSFAIVFNNTQAPFDDAAVRKAFAMAVDRSAIIEQVLPGGVQVSYSWVPEGMEGYDADLGEEWALDPEAAREMLAEAGYPAGRGLPEVVFAHREDQLPMAEALRDQIEANLGVTIRLEQVDEEESRARLQSGEYQIAGFGWSSTVPEPSGVLVEPFGCQRYEGERCTQFSSANRAYYANPEYDRLLSQAIKELDPERRQDLYDEAHEVLVDDVPAIFLGTFISRFLVKPYVNDLIPLSVDPDFPGSFFLDKTYIQGRNADD